MLRLRAKARAPDSLSVGGTANAADIGFSTARAMVGRWGNHEKVTTAELLRMPFGARLPTSYDRNGSGNLFHFRNKMHFSAGSARNHVIMQPIFEATMKSVLLLFCLVGCALGQGKANFTHSPTKTPQ